MDNRIRTSISQRSVAVLEALIEDILDFPSLEGLQGWLNQH